ncbi:putative manganese transporter [Thermophilibacter provencensis]|uniref:Manganese transporter n=1 Tax=Thermophilibacter provencensis TaxID=1852386 RepID=A0ABT7V4D2_9ACTN|nr:putative manganese transporter [Thermophilibacter provencensis]MDM8271455.1 putative manganese transporter [Thermophilibacter provencensis]
MDLLLHVLEHSFFDTLALVPFLFLTYLAMEAIEHSASAHVQAAVERSGKAGPVVGSLLGALPQCGFSAMAATLYAGRVVTAGTLVAVILSTSDEMVPVFLAHQEPVTRMLAIMAVKVVVGVAVGLLVDVALRAWHRAGDGHLHIHELCEREHCHCDDDANDHGHEHGHGRWAIVRSALVHTAQVTFFIFVVTFVFGLIIEYVGQDALGALLANHPVRATFLAALIGLIPNCGASVAVTELYLDGVLATGPMLAGLLASGGVGLLVLWRTNASAGQNAIITAFVYGVAVAVGLFAGALGILF